MWNEIDLLSGFPQLRPNSIVEPNFYAVERKPKQEQNLLRLLVNKLLGVFSSLHLLPLTEFSDKPLSSHASHLLLQVWQTHPAMKAVIVREIMALVLRPSSAPAAMALSSTPANKHIRFNDSELSKRKPAISGTDKKPGGDTAHVLYYVTITFNQTVLSPGDRDDALNLIDVCFELLKELLGEGVGGSDGVREEEELVKKKKTIQDRQGWEEQR